MVISGGASEYDFSGCNDTVQSFKEALWTKIIEKFNSPEITAHKVFSDDERNLMKKASDYFAEFCNTPHEGEGWYAENVTLEEGVPLETGYVKKDGWYSVALRKRKPAPFEKDLSHTWDLCLTGF